MNNSISSTIKYLSNLQPLQEKNPLEDRDFLSHVHDPVALVELKRKIDNKLTDYRLTAIQKEEYENASVHCVFAFEDDYPWGTVLLNGERQVICKCTKQYCEHFLQCRAAFPFDQSELEVYFRDDEIQTPDIIDLIPYNSEKAKPQQEIKILTADEPRPPEEMPIDETAFKEPDPEPALITVNINNECEVVNEVDTGTNISFDNNAFTVGSFVKTDQDAVINASWQERIIVNAGPGTGKTWTLIRRLIHLVNEENVDPEEILVLCFSRAAVEVIKKRLWHAFERNECSMMMLKIEIRTFDSFSTKMLCYILENNPERFPASFKICDNNYIERIIHTTKKLSETPELMSLCKHMIVDEVQDLVMDRANLVLGLLDSLKSDCGFTLLGDSCQSIYDYQVVSQDGMSSKRFYQTLFHKYKNCNFFEFTFNHRQKKDIADLGAVLRNAILANSVDDCKIAFENVIEMTTDITDIKLDQITAEKIGELRGSGNLGILCWRNDEVLRISTWLRNSNIPHSVQRNQSERAKEALAGWIGQTFSTYEYETIDKDMFVSKFDVSIPKDSNLSSEACWDALVDAQVSIKTRYKVSELLTGILNNAKDPILFSSDKTDVVVVSTVHKAKGKEFDSVILLKDLLEPDFKKDFQIKVPYVALTRARDKIYISEIKQQHSTKKYRQWHAPAPIAGKRSRISSLEVGLNGDIDILSTASSIELQSFIRTFISIGSRIILKKRYISEIETKYDIYLEDEDCSICLGSMSSSFMKSYRDKLRINYKMARTEPVPAGYYASQMTDIFVDNIFTSISVGRSGIPGAHRFDDIYVWNYPSIVGYASLGYDRY